MANNPVDPLQLLQAALTAPANSQEQATLLATLRESLESQPSPIPILAQTLFSVTVNAGDSLLKRWVLDLVHFAICRSTLTLDQKTQMAVRELDSLVQLIEDPSPAVVKVAIQILTGVYPLVFRYLCTNRSNVGPWNTISACKSRIIEMVWGANVNVGVKISAMKFVQRVILVQTRGVSDPRLQNKNDPNIAFCPADHPFISVAKLEAEGQKLLEGLTATLYSSQDVDLLSALLNSWVALVKQRPATLPYVVSAFGSWTPAALVGLDAASVKSVEKAVRILLIHISKMPASSQYVPQINITLSQQSARMEKAAIEEKKRKAALAESRKRPPSTAAEPADSKRIKLDELPQPSSTSFLSAFDFTSLPAPLITNLIVANLEAFTESQLVSLVNNFRQSRGLPAPQPSASTTVAPNAAPVALPVSSVPTAPRKAVQATKESANALPQAEPPDVVKQEPVDPMKMVIDEEELEYEPEKLNAELSGVGDADEPAAIATGAQPINLELVDFQLPLPKNLTESERQSLVVDSIDRIWDGADELKGDGLAADSLQAGGNSAAEIWMLLLVRMITRVAEPPTDAKEEDSMALVGSNFYSRQDHLRQVLCDYIMQDFTSRIRLATTWMNEEWYNDQVRSQDDRNWRPNYESWLNHIMTGYQNVLDGKDKTFSRFLLDLPSVPGGVLDLLRDFCVDSSNSDRLQVGFLTLRGFVMQRPALRIEALNVLLELTTHSEKRTRAAAINTVKLWVPNHHPIWSMIRQFALQMLRKLQLGKPPSKEKETEEDEDEDEDTDMDDLVHTPYLPERIELPAQKPQVLQHLELLFALCVKVPELLDDIFESYTKMDETVQEAIQDLITALIRSLGSSHAKLLTILRKCPEGAESLALRVLTIFTENGRPSAPLVALVKGLINERNLDARFLIPIIAEMDKADIMKHLPRIVSSLNGQAENKNLVRSVFGSIVTTPPQTFGSVTSNLPRVRQSELLTPAELMVLLHDSEKEIGRKSAIEAIGICFSMTDVFRSEVLAVVMQQIMDEPVLPVLFLRTVIQAVTTYKSLVGFVSTTLLSRLITKKIWTNPPLWEGFIWCAKVIAPASFGALLQLPKDQLRELVDKQPSLKSGLRDYVTKKAPNKARVAGFLDIFGESDEQTQTQASSQPQPDDSEMSTS
ncbi:Symplekin tight junction protein C terminal-domain-containing protein [Panaeolus papilionaceus]|nr:Symplekin tight junction protein C terminal-domain-containing protein [Panaeolus papilionaceus]